MQYIKELKEKLETRGKFYNIELKFSEASVIHIRVQELSIGSRIISDTGLIGVDMDAEKDWNYIEQSLNQSKARFIL